MAIDSDTFGTSQSLGVDATETIALFKLSDSSIDRREIVHVSATSAESFDFRVDVGVPPLGTDLDAEADIDWFEAKTGSVSPSSDGRVSLEVTELYVRLVVTSAAPGGTTAQVATTKGR